MSDRHYTGEEADFVFFALPDYNVESIDNFVDGNQRAIARNTKGERVEGDFVVLGAEIVSFLREIRAGAFAAYRAGEIDLMMAKLGQLEAQCNWRGLAFATKSIVSDYYGSRVKQSERQRGNAENRHPIAWSGKDGRALFTDELVAAIAPSKAVMPRITRDGVLELWHKFFHLLGDGHEELDPELCGDDDERVTFNINDPRKRKNDDSCEPKRGKLMRSTFKKYLDAVRNPKTKVAEKTASKSRLRKGSPEHCNRGWT